MESTKITFSGKTGGVHPAVIGGKKYISNISKKLQKLFIDRSLGANACVRRNNVREKYFFSRVRQELVNP
jgi:hypothetical protein